LSKPLKVIFAGTPDFAAKHLQALISSHHDVVAVYCPPDKPAGRGKKLTACATKQLALENNLVVEQPANFKETSDQEVLAQYKADVMVVVAYGLLLPKVILDTPKLGCINVHGSLLPKWRGAAPIQRSLEAGDHKTGVTIMQMDIGLDTGDMILKAASPITEHDTSASLYEKLAKLGPTALLETLDMMSSGQYQREPQQEELANYAAKLTKEEATMDWSLPAEVIHRKIRAYIPWPVAQFTLIDENQKPHNIRIWQASTVIDSSNAEVGRIIHADKTGIIVKAGVHAVRLESLQIPGKKAMSAADLLNGRADWFTIGQKITGQSCQ
jgi:methionyl-tRNA formyltransferase